MLQASSTSIRSVKDLVKKIEVKSNRLSTKSAATHNSNKSKKSSKTIEEEPELDVSDNESLSDFSIESGSSDGSRFQFSVGVQSIKDEIEERIKKSRQQSSYILPSTYVKTMVKSESLIGLYQSKKTDSSVFGDESPLFGEDKTIQVIKQSQPEIINTEEDENKTVVTNNNDNKTVVTEARTIFTQIAETMTQMYQPESVFGEESPFFIGEPIPDEESRKEQEEEEEEDDVPNISERTDKEISDDESRMEMSAITMNEHQFLSSYPNPTLQPIPEESPLDVVEPKQQDLHSCLTEGSTKVTSDALGTAVLKILQEAIINSNSNASLQKSMSSASSLTSGSARTSSEKSIELQKEDEEDKERLRNFLREVGCTQTKANNYATILVGNGIPTVEVLTRRVQRDPFYLEKIGFDEFFARDIVELLTPDAPSVPHQQQQLQQQQMLKNTYSSNFNMLQSLPSLKSMNSMQETTLDASSNLDFLDEFSEIRSPNVSEYSPAVTAFKFDILPSETSSIYYQAMQQNSIEATDRLVELAEQGDIFAQGFIMRMKALGQGPFPKDIEKAKEIARMIFPTLRETVRSKLEDQMIYACYLLGVCYSEGLVGEKNPKEAIKWYKQAAKQGYDAAQAYVGYALYSGIGVVGNKFEAVKWYSKSADQGYAPAQTNLGICYELGDGCQKNLLTALKWYRLAAEQNDPTALYNIGHCYELGLGVPQDIFKASEYYTQAADLNNAAAQYALGYLYSVGYPCLPQSIEETVRLYKLSADQGHAEAQCKLGLMYENGIGTETDVLQAVKYYRLAANQGNPAALYYLGYCYYNGLGVEKDTAVAVKLYYKSAAKNYSAAQNNLGFCYFVGTGVKKNYLEAIKWYRKAAEQGYPAAQYNLGYCYEKGYGVQARLQDMLKWYRLAAKAGHPKANTKMKQFTAK
jgi:TPR repeat protein